MCDERIHPRHNSAAAFAKKKLRSTLASSWYSGEFPTRDPKKKLKNNNNKVVHRREIERVRRTENVCRRWELKNERHRLSHIIKYYILSILYTLLWLWLFFFLVFIQRFESRFLSFSFLYFSLFPFSLSLNVFVLLLFRGPLICTHSTAMLFVLHCILLLHFSAMRVRMRCGRKNPCKSATAERVQKKVLKKWDFFFFLQTSEFELEHQIVDVCIITIIRNIFSFYIWLY